MLWSMFRPDGRPKPPPPPDDEPLNMWDDRLMVFGLVSSLVLIILMVVFFST